MIRDQLPRWTFASILSHMNTNITGIHTHMEGEAHDTSGQSDWTMVRVTGPNIAEVSKTLLRIECTVNIIIGTVKHSTNLYQESTNIGIVTGSFTDIDLYKYGNEVGDDGSFLGCLKLQPTRQIADKITVTRYGQIDPEVKLHQAVVTGDYEMLIEDS